MMTRNISGRKKGRKKRKVPKHIVEADSPARENSAPYDEINSGAFPEESDRARRARRERHHRSHKKRKHGRPGTSSDDDQGTAASKNPQVDSMAVLSNAVSSSHNTISKLASRLTSRNPSFISFLTRIHAQLKHHWDYDGYAREKIDTDFQEWVPTFPKSYRYFSLFRYASTADYILLTIGVLAAVVAGCCIPFSLYLFGNLIRVKVLVDKMGCNPNDSENCRLFLKNCDLTLTDGPFSKRPLNVSQISDEYMIKFIDLELTITFVYTVCSSIYFFCWNYTSHNQGSQLRMGYFLSLIHKDMTWHEAQQGNLDVINRTMENTCRVEEVIGESIPIAISLTVMGILCFALAFFHGWELTVICLLILPLFLSTMGLVDRRKAARILKTRRAYRVAHDLAKEVFSKMRTVIGYGTQSAELSLYYRELARGNGYVTRAIVLQSLAVGLMYVVSFGGWAGLFWYGMMVVHSSNAKHICSDQASREEYDAGDFVVVILSLLLGCANLYTVMILVKSVPVATMCGRDVLKIIDGSNGIDNMSLDGLVPEEPLLGKVEFINVRFTYPDRKRGLVLNNFSFVAEANSLVAIVGISNSGKSTALKLICKEYLVDSGHVLLDGYDVRSLNTEWLRAHIGYIPQELTLFDMTIEDNVRMGKLDASFFQIQEACMAAGAHEFIISFKEGYQTSVGHRGNRLTPGQQQLLSIARALIRDPQILLLDEVMCDLDSNSVAEMMLSLQKIALGRTVILVANRLATVVHADMIYVLKNGKLVEKGDHHQLINANGAYSQLCKMNPVLSSDNPDSVKVEGIDTSEMSIISCAKTFNQTSVLPGLYHTALGIDPVVTAVTDTILTGDKDTERGFYAKLEWVLEDGHGLSDTTTATRMEEDALGNELRTSASSASSTNSANHNTAAEALYEVPFGTTRPIIQNSGKDPISDGFQSTSCSSKSTFIRMLTMASTNPWLIFVGVVSTVFLSIGMPLFGLLFALTIDVLANFTKYPHKWRWASYFDNLNASFPVMVTLSLVVLGLCSGIFAFLQDLCLNLAGYKSVQKMRRFLHRRILSQDTSFFEDPQNTPIVLASILFQDTDSIQHVTFGFYATLLQCICTFIVVLFLCMIHTLDLSGYTVLVMLVVVFFSFFDGWLAKKQHGQAINVLQQMSKWILQLFQSKHVITVCQMESHLMIEFYKAQRKPVEVINRLGWLRLITFGLGKSALLWGFGLILHLGQDRIHIDSYTLFDLIITGFIIIFGLISLGTNLSVLTGFKHVGKGGRRMMDIINRKPLMLQENNLQITEYDCTQTIEFVNAHFWKPHTPDLALLKGINFTFQPMQVTAVVGYPESGMSGFLELLGNFYNPTDGLVTVAGKDLRYVTAESLREYVSIIPQESELFSRTVAQNIALGAASQRPSMDEVIQAAKEANVHNLIVSLPNGYETRIGGEHDYLSKSQKQRICIARALLKNPKILIYDFTTSLDREGERAIMETIMEIKVNRTVILLSHRIEPVQHADWIIVMEKGYLEEQGVHADLLQKRHTEIYAHMWRSQNPLQDANFLKGNISFLGKSRFESLQGKRSRSRLHADQSRLSANDAGLGNEKAPTGCFGFFGRGIIDSIEEKENFGGEQGDGSTN